MRIAFVTQWFPPEPATVPAEIASGLARRGHRVDVVTGFPNYPSGQLVQGYPVRPYRREILADGVIVHRAPLYPSHDTSAVRRMANYTSFALGAAAVAAAAVPTPDVWLTYSSPATAALPALTSGRLRATVRLHPAPHYQIIQDLWPDSVTGSGIGGRLTSLAEPPLQRYCTWSYRHSAGIGVISPGMRSILRARGVFSDKIFDTPNWVNSPAPLPVASPARRAELGLPIGRLFVYAGNLGELQALPELVNAFAGRPEATLVLIGAGVQREQLATDIATRQLRNIHLLPAQPPDRIGAYLAAADALVVSLADTPLLRATMPSKVQSSLAAGRAILAHAAGDVADVVVGSGAGRSASPDQPEAVAAAITELATCPQEQLDQHGRRGRAHYEATYTPRAGLDALEYMLTAHLRSGTGRYDPLPPVPQFPGAAHS